MFIFGFFLKGEDLRFFNWKLKKNFVDFLSPLSKLFLVVKMKMLNTITFMLRPHDSAWKVSFQFKYTDPSNRNSKCSIC